MERGKVGFTQMFVRFVRQESFGGIFLFFCAILAMVVANSPFSQVYFDFWHTKVGLSVAGNFFGFSIHNWIGDVLMAFFFLMVGLEIKREVLFGELAGFKKAAFPAIGAIGGMIVPAIIYISINPMKPTLDGFGIPMATDIAFALGVLLVLGKRIPTALKVFLVTLAVVDDLGAILVIAIFYTSSLSFMWLFASVFLVGILVLMNKIGIRSLWAYLFFGVLLWFTVHSSGIHATIAAVALAFCIPVKPKIQNQSFLDSLQGFVDGLMNKGRERSDILLDNEQIHILDNLISGSKNVQNPLLRLEHMLQPWCAYFIMPLFAFANAGVSIGDAKLEIDTIMVGIALGLIVGKPLGIFLFTYVCEKIGIASRPNGISWKHIVGAGMLAGIGFTMSMFVSNLAFGENDHFIEIAKISILMSSMIAGILGSIYIFLAHRD